VIAEPAAEVAPERPTPRQPIPDTPAVAPARGHGGVQAGVHEPSPVPAHEPAPEDTMAQPVRTGADDPDVAAPDDDGPPRERVQFGESDDLLADVDNGVNENEFKW